MLDFGFWILALRSVNTYVKQGLSSDEINPLRRFDPVNELFFNGLEKVSCGCGLEVKLREINTGRIIWLPVPHSEKDFLKEVSA